MVRNRLISDTTKTGRPFGVSVIAVLLAVFGIFVALVGLLGMFTGFVVGIMDAPRVAGGVFLAGFGAFVIGLAYLTAAAGLWALRPWAWWLAIVAGIVGFVLAVGSPVWMVVWAALTVYLFLVRSNFAVLPNAPQVTRA